MSELAIIDKPATDLITVEALKAEVVFAPGGVEKIIAEITAKVRAIKTDISTKAGRAELSSLAYKIARSKTALDEMGKDLVADWKKRTGVVDAERRSVRDRLDALRDEVRKPLTDWENADKARVEAHEAALAELTRLSQFEQAEPSAFDISVRIETLEARPARDWQEFVQRAGETTGLTRRMLTEMLTSAEKREAERAETERLRREQIERERKEREGKIAAEAAERARLAAETRAAEEAKAAADRAAAEQRRVEQDRADAIARAEKAETDRKAAEEKAEADRKAAAEKAESDRIAAEKKAANEMRAAAEKTERDRIAAEERVAADKRAAAAQAERDRVAAIEAERKRVADAKAAEDAATAKREADKKHRGRINTEASAALAGFGIDKLVAGRLIDAISDGKIPHVTISY